MIVGARWGRQSINAECNISDCRRIYNLRISRTGELIRQKTFVAHEWTGLYH